MANVFVRVNFICNKYYIWDDAYQSEQEGGYAFSKKSGQDKNVAPFWIQWMNNFENATWCEAI